MVATYQISLFPLNSKLDMSATLQGPQILPENCVSQNLHAKSGAAARTTLKVTLSTFLLIGSMFPSHGTWPFFFDKPIYSAFFCHSGCYQTTLFTNVSTIVVFKCLKVVHIFESALYAIRQLLRLAYSIHSGQLTMSTDCKDKLTQCLIKMWNVLVH